MRGHTDAFWLVARFDDLCFIQFNLPANFETGIPEYLFRKHDGMTG